MPNTTHSHKGVERASGALRSHPISRVHNDAQVQIWHENIMNVNKRPKKAKTKVKQTKGIFARCPVDSDGYISIDLDKTNHGTKGLRIKFTRTEERKRRKVALQINK